MSISFSEAVNTLVAGEPLEWPRSEQHSSGNVVLDTPAARRLFTFLHRQNSQEVAAAPESLFEGLIEAWENTSFDPASSVTIGGLSSANSTWRLIRLETSGFGGLNSFKGPDFDLQFNNENWCLEGPNGSGKSSIVSAIVWAMTGLRIKDQDGIFFDDGKRIAVFNREGEEIGSWPPLVSYPTNIQDLKQPARAWVRLSFQNETGDIATAFRQLEANLTGDPVIEKKIDDQLLSAPQLIEAGLLMPARLARIGFGEKSQSVYEAVKLLTGLDQLSDIGEAAANFSHRGKRFLKYAQDNGIKNLETKIENALLQAIEKARDAEFGFAPKYKLGDKDYSTELRKIAGSAAKKAADHFSVLKMEIGKELDIEKTEDRAAIISAADEARGILQQSTFGIPVFEAWRALTEAPAHPGFSELPILVTSAIKKLEEAVTWNERQLNDRKLRLKAVAAHYFIAADHEHFDSFCPLCEQRLDDDAQKALAAELALLKESSEEAQRKLSDACAIIEKEVRDSLPLGLSKHFETLSKMQPRESFEATALEKFVTSAPFSNILTGISEFTQSFLVQAKQNLPEFVSSVDDPEITYASDETQNLCDYLSSLERILSLVKWWTENCDLFRTSWSTLKGTRNQEGDFPYDSIEGRLKSLENALDDAAPLDAISLLLNTAADHVDEWQAIQLQQEIRENIAKALAPLKDLRTLVAAETAGSISSLAENMRSVLDRIHFRERLSFGDAQLHRKSVQVSGSFSEGLQIDASTVANSSWLRAILWAFVISLREQTITKLGTNPFPLMVMDDPQATFDPRNKRKWAEEIVRLANLDSSKADAMQLVLTTHERQFFQILVDVEKLQGQQGLIMRLNDLSNVTTILNGTSLQRTYEDAIANNNDESGHKYVSQVRTYCEDLLKVMFRSEGPHVADMSLDALRENLKRLRKASVSPFNRQPFEKLLKVVEGNSKVMQLINDVHHKFDGTIGVAEASDVRDFWEHSLQDEIHDCFKVYAEFEAYTGEPRVFPWMENVVKLPVGIKDDVRKIYLQNTGVAAAALTDGRVGDGLITLEEFDDIEAINLPNHEIYQLSAGTLDPIAGVGDLVIVSNYAKVRERNLVVTAFGRQLLARRYNESEIHPQISVLTGEALDPYSLPQPIIVAKERVEPKKIVGTIFASHRLPVPPKNDDAEICLFEETNLLNELLDNARLFKVSGRSAEPIALDGQYLITSPSPIRGEVAANFEGRLVVAVDQNGARYFKRFRLRKNLVILESLNLDGTTPAEILDLDESGIFPKFAEMLEVLGVLFELPSDG